MPGVASSHPPHTETSAIPTLFSNSLTQHHCFTHPVRQVLLLEREQTAAVEQERRVRSLTCVLRMATGGYVGEAALSQARRDIAGGYAT